METRKVRRGLSSSPARVPKEKNPQYSHRIQETSSDESSSPDFSRGEGWARVGASRRRERSSKGEAWAHVRVAGWGEAESARLEGSGWAGREGLADGRSAATVATGSCVRHARSGAWCCRVVLPHHDGHAKHVRCRGGAVWAGV
jgi:hypothetical protein